MTKAEENKARVAANKRNAWFKRVNTLTGFMFGRIDRDEAAKAYDAGTTADAFAATIASRSPVGAAVHPLKVEAVKQAAADAHKTVIAVRDELAAAGWNIEPVAPYPSTRNWHNGKKIEYETALAKYRLFARLTMNDPVNGKPTHRPGEPRIVVMCDEHVAEFVMSEEREAAAQYDAFIVKLVAKIGPDAIAATLDGNHIWSHSILTVEIKPPKWLGSYSERWKTKQIVNTSKFGKRFAQWPSRKIR